MAFWSQQQEFYLEQKKSTWGLKHYVDLHMSIQR